MKSQKFIRFVESFILLPAITISGSLGSFPPGGSIAATSQIVFSQKLNNVTEIALAPEQVVDFEAELRREREEKATAIDRYFRVRSMPLAGLGMKMVLEAERNDLDWRLIPAIAIRESTGGKYECKKVENNPFGWNSCKTGFDSYDHAIEIVAMNLSGSNPNTRKAYAGKSTEGILKAYNPPHIVANYASQVMRIMNKIGSESLAISENASA
ncbi:MAG: hypothetical protein AAB500_01970 [Patescibacteria group bacterium]